MARRLLLITCFVAAALATVVRAAEMPPMAPPPPSVQSATNAALLPIRGVTDDALESGYEAGGMRRRVERGQIREVGEEPPVISVPDRGAAPPARPGCQVEPDGIGCR